MFSLQSLYIVIGMAENKLIGVIDAGTNTVKFVIYQIPQFNQVCSHEVKIRQISTNNGWVEHDPEEIIKAVRETAKVAIAILHNFGFKKSNIASIGVTNQRETIILWSKKVR